MKMIRKFYRNIFAPASSIDLATIELEKAKKAFLEAKTHTEFYAAQVEFESIRIKRLEEYVNIVVDAGELVTNPLYQQVTPTAMPPVEKVLLVKPAVKKRVVVAKKVARKRAVVAKKVARKRVI